MFVSELDIEAKSNDRVIGMTLIRIRFNDNEESRNATNPRPQYLFLTYDTLLES